MILEHIFIDLEHAGLREPRPASARSRQPERCGGVPGARPLHRRADGQARGGGAAKAPPRQGALAEVINIYKIYV